MRRRNFFQTLATAVAGFAILPPATTYERVWKATRTTRNTAVWITNPEWITAEYEIREGGQIWEPKHFYGKWTFVIDEYGARGTQTDYYVGGVS